jgi:hypothetical protein
VRPSRRAPSNVELAVSGPGALGGGVAIAEDDLAALVALDRGDGHAVLVEAVAREDFGCGDERLGHGLTIGRVNTRVNTQTGRTLDPIDAGAKAWFDRVQSQRLDAGRKRPDGQLWQWDDLTESDHRAYRAIVAPIVKAALEVHSSPAGGAA